MASKDLAPTRVDLEHLRKQPKKVRFCPSCGYRRRVAVALHYVCQVCEYEFVVLPRKAVKNVRHLHRLPILNNEVFDIVAVVDVPPDRRGVKDLVGGLRERDPPDQPQRGRRYDDIA